VSDLWRTVKSAGLKPEHREWLKDAAAGIAAKFQASTMVNIGIYYGASMHCIRAGAPSVFLLGIDIKNWGVEGRGELKAFYWWADSTTCHTGFALPIHLLFLDGVQVYEGAVKDVFGWCPKVVVGGLAIFNTCHLPPPRWGMGQAVDEWLRTPGAAWEDIEAPDPIRAIRRIT